jgi:hypothetical protein
VIIPRAALIRSAGAVFVYVRRDATHFERRRIADGQVDAAGLFARAGFRPGDPVAVSGAAALFAAETGVKDRDD